MSFIDSRHYHHYHRYFILNDICVITVILCSDPALPVFFLLLLADIFHKPHLIFQKLLYIHHNMV